MSKKTEYFKELSKLLDGVQPEMLYNQYLALEKNQGPTVEQFLGPGALSEEQNEFNFNLKEMKDCLSGDFVEVPFFGTSEELDAWLTDAFEINKKEE